MCRGYQQNERDGRLLRIKAFSIRLLVSDSGKGLPDSLTLYYSPRINGRPLEVNGTKIKPDSPAFVTLHRVVSAAGGAVLYGSRERVRASEGVRFEVLLGDEKVLKGVFRKDGRDEWQVGCGCGLDSEVAGLKVAEAEVCVAAEGGLEMRERVEMVVNRRRRRRRRSRWCFLEEIPEEREVEAEAEMESDGCWCCCGEEGMDGGDGKEGEEEEMGTEMEGVSLAVDVGIWVMCLGVGYLVSKASFKTLLRRTRIL
ncbi:hypothetical protein RJ639_003452 [Escallonia herrerae]|uniref:Uncharacterized protein n=1 Tax=Escallonia herrerae TaxID=1293975 RepID=A0AA89AVV7_9ASTE|nr:hypothetical protein RJ639_003452 [Escallonia herrerae]